MRIRYFTNLICLFVLALLLMGATHSEVYFQMKDPVGDEHGYGTYQYPSNVAFKPYQGLFDITEFKVLPGEKGQLCFDTSFIRVTNPWMAPEGFIHQNLRIFIDTKSNQGLTQLPYPGANIRFDPKYAWDVCLKVVGWGNSQLLNLENGVLKARGLNTELLDDKCTIRAFVPEIIIGRPTKNWHYYVMVGSYDGFGDDFFRKVATKRGEWVIGGGTGRKIEPQVLDILASKDGRNNQVNQLRSYDLKTGKLAGLYPVGSDLSNRNLLTWLYICLFMLFISGLTYLISKKPSCISWFWIKSDLKKI